MKYLVTGAAGFIGSRVAEMLLVSGELVVGVDNMNDAYDVRIKEYRLSLLKRYPRFIFHLSDICKRGDLDSIIEKQLDSPSSPPFDGVINLAARAGVRHSVQNPWVYYETNVTGTLNLLEACRQYHIPKFVLASTSSVYGDNAPLPTPEEAASDWPLQPYAASKKGAEVLCYTYHHLYGIDVSVFRYFTVYGMAGRPDMVMFRFIQWINEGRPLKLYGNGEQSRGFTYLDDVARGTLLGLKPVGYEIFNLGGHECLKINDLISMLESMVGKKATVERLPRDPADLLANWAKTEKARRLLNWEPKVSIQEGMLNLLKWYNAERSWASQVVTD